MADPKITPAHYTPDISYAVKAMAEGKATEGQQKMLFEWNLFHACLTYDQSFVAGEPDVTAFKEGRRFVGNTWLKMLKLTPEQLKEDNDRSDN